MAERLRQAEDPDCATLAALDACLNPSPWSEQSFREALARWRVLIAEDAAGSVCGFVVYAVGADDSEIHDIAVARAWQRRGIGRMLLEAVLADAAQDGARRCLLEVRESNHAAQALYRGRGFAVDGRRKAYYRVEHGREDALLMSRELP